jgi:hypothetical protein
MEGIMSDRKGFNFFKSYFDVYNLLKKEHKLLFIDALLQRQFYGIEPKGLQGNANFAYISQKHNIDSQVNGWEDKTNKKLHPPTTQVIGMYEEKENTPPPTVGGVTPPTDQVIEKGKGKVKVIEQRRGLFKIWVDYRKKINKPIKDASMELLIKKFNETDRDILEDSVNNSIENGYQGLFPSKGNVDNKRINRNAIKDTDNDFR